MSEQTTIEERAKKCLPFGKDGMRWAIQFAENEVALALAEQERKVAEADREGWERARKLCMSMTCAHGYNDMSEMAYRPPPPTPPYPFGKHASVRQCECWHWYVAGKRWRFLDDNVAVYESGIQVVCQWCGAPRVGMEVGK